MKGLDSREITVINAIHRNHQQQIKNQMVAHFTVYFDQSMHPDKIYSWLEQIEETRLLANQYLESIAPSASLDDQKALQKATSGSVYFFNKIKLLIPEKIRIYFANSEPPSTGPLLFKLITAELFSGILNKSIISVLFDYFRAKFSGSEEDAQKQFAASLEKQPELSHLIKKECEYISVELIKLFHFREMLLLGKLSNEPFEPNARQEFISRAKLETQSVESINTAIELYFAKELSAIFNSGFQFLYKVHEIEIQSELHSVFIKWINQFTESDKIRLAFTQEIQLKFMLVSRDFLLGKLNQPTFLARHPIFFSLTTGVITGFALGITLALTVGGAIAWPLALGALVLAGIGTYFLINKVSLFAFKRSSKNREQIQQSINMINNEYLRLSKVMLEKKNTSNDAIEQTKNFAQVNQQFLKVIEEEKVARGSISGWLREYASRYRHSKAVEVDLGDEYKHIIIQSRTQTDELTTSLNKNEFHVLKAWIKGTHAYLGSAKNQDVIQDFELIHKIKEQVLEIVSHINYVPPKLLEFYCLSIASGGLGGNESDFAYVKRFFPRHEITGLEQNPYKFLCDTALKLFKDHEPYHNAKPIFLGDPEYRQMLGIARGNHKLSITAENVESYLKNSYTFLLSLCHKISPGLGLDPLQQPAQISEEFILYRMLLLKQLTSLCNAEHKEISTEVKIKISKFIQKHFNQDPRILFDNLANQHFLLNKEIQQSKIFKNNDGVMVNGAELDNIQQAINLDIVYNSFRFKLQDVLHYYINDFFKHHKCQNTVLFAYRVSEQELNPQGTIQYNQLLTQFCENTSAFFQACTSNEALTETNILECYKYNISLQIYRTQLRIIKDIKHLNQPNTLHESTQQIELLLQSFEKLNSFAQKHCFNLKNNASCYKLFEFVSNKTRLTPAKNWIKHIDATDALIHMMEQLPGQIQLKPAAFNTQNHFFKTELPIKAVTAIRPKEDVSILMKDRI